MLTKLYLNEKEKNILKNPKSESEFVADTTNILYLLYIRALYKIWGK